MHKFWGHFFDLTNITLGTSNFDLTPGRNKRGFKSKAKALPYRRLFAMYGSD